MTAQHSTSIAFHCFRYMCRVTEWGLKSGIIALYVRSIDHPTLRREEAPVHMKCDVGHRDKVAVGVLGSHQIDRDPNRSSM